MPRYTGSCHCGAVRFEIEAVIDRVTECNCSICRKKGILHHRVAADGFHLLSGEADLGTYRFGTMAAKHHFCKTCGIHVFTRPRAAPELYTVNVRVLDEFDLSRERPEIVQFDGLQWEENVASLK
ncbi:MAG: GFA family protein [Burkholderiales bacterium]|nr:GFA family protein [Burkholderiales bacterium]